MYSYIKDPYTNLDVSIHSRLGKYILHKYIRFFQKPTGDICKILNGKYCKGHLSYKRVDMPQFDTKEDLVLLEKILKPFNHIRMETKNISFRTKGGLSRGPSGTGEILLTQDEISISKVVRLCPSKKKGNIPIILITNGLDGFFYILDGHHRAVSKMLCSKNPYANVLFIYNTASITSKDAVVEIGTILRNTSKSQHSQLFKNYQI